MCVEEDAAIASLCVEVSSSVLLHYRGVGGGIKCLAFSLSGKDRVSIGWSFQAQTNGERVCRNIESK